MSEKESYEAPQLVEVGEVAELTREFGTKCSEMMASSVDGGITYGQCLGGTFS